MVVDSLRFNSRRSVVFSTKGIVSSTQTLASSAGIKILEKGGNCIDASVAVSASLCVTEPSSTGVGGDFFCLYYKDKDKVIEGINGTGRSAKSLSAEFVKKYYNDPSMKRIPNESIFSVNVPGAICGWIDAIEKWGSGNVSLEEILEPSIDLAENGFFVGAISADLWKNEEEKLRKQNANCSYNPFLVNGKTPAEGQFVDNKPLAKALRKIAKEGKEGFYSGEIADAIIAQTDARGHKLSHEDLKAHTSTFVEPIAVEFCGKKIWEIPPNGQGLVALLILGMLEELQQKKKIDLFSMKHNSAEYLHLLIELAKIAFYDADEYVSDPEFSEYDVKTLLTSDYLAHRSMYYTKTGILNSSVMSHGVPNSIFKSDTVYLTVTDSNGDACSFINSVYEGFGSGILVPEFGFCLHNRGANFNLTEGSSNCLEGGKRPYHTIIPSMITNTADNSLYASFGNMGGYMQALGQVQHVLNMLVFNFSPQELIDLPRFCLCAHDDEIARGLDRGKGPDGPISTPTTIVALEDGIEQSVADELERLGHAIQLLKGSDRRLFGRAQIIKRINSDGVYGYAAGSDPRGDGAAIPLV